MNGEESIRKVNVWKFFILCNLLNCRLVSQDSYVDRLRSYPVRDINDLLD